MWFVQRIIRTISFNGELLPTVECVLRSGSEKISAIGWLPCHHSNVAYTLILKKRKERKKQKTDVFNIVSILDIKCTKKKSTIPKFRSREYEDYKYISNKSYTDIALWTISVVYPFWTIKNMNIQNTFKRLITNIENICKRGQKDAIHIYDKKNAKIAIEKALCQMGELPYNDWEGFESRMDWQIETRYNTASFKKPSNHVSNVENYKGVWTTTDEIEKSITIVKTMTPENTDMIIGSMSNENVPKDAIIVVRNLEDAYRLSCQINYKNVKVCMINLPFNLQEKCSKLSQLGVYFVTTLPKNTHHVHVAWSHLWGIGDWLSLIEQAPRKYTLVGRLDQYNMGRGQIFRDMYESQRYSSKVVSHVLVDEVIEEHSDEKRSINMIIDEISKRHDTVQCFTDSHMKGKYSIDTGRRCLYKPFRIRTICKSSRDKKKRATPLYEENITDDILNINSSVVSIKTFHGVQCRACVFLCSEKTTPFDIRAAMSHARDVLYIINCTTCLFALKKICPPRITVSPF